MGNHIQTGKDPQEKARLDVLEQLSNIHLLPLLDYSHRLLRTITCVVFWNLGNRQFLSLIIQAACSDDFNQSFDCHLCLHRLDLLREFDVWCNRSDWTCNRLD